MSKSVNGHKPTTRKPPLRTPAGKRTLGGNTDFNRTGASLRAQANRNVPPPK